MGLESLRARLRIQAYTAFRRRPADDPSEIQMSRIIGWDRLPFFGAPVTQTLTGDPSEAYAGETVSPQRIESYPRLPISVDAQVGVSTQQFPSLPTSRRVRGRLP